jgi:hypothetical protein
MYIYMEGDIYISGGREGERVLYIYIYIYILEREREGENVEGEKKRETVSRSLTTNVFHTINVFHTLF